MPRKARFRKIRIDWRKSETAWGVAYCEDHRIELDPRMTDETLLEVASHEVAHIVLPFLDEEAVELLGRHIGDVLTRLGFSRVEEH
jgi:predicted SprT family Zn-dependent metalloprotease